MRKILVADDEPDMLETLAQLLRMAFSDCAIRTATDGQEAYDIAVRESPSVVLADFKMPRLDGFELARRLDDEGRQTAIILMTAFADSSLEARAGEFPLVRRLFKKPIDPPALLSAIQGLLDDLGATGTSEGEGAP